LAAPNPIRQRKVSQSTVDAMNKTAGDTEVHNPYLLGFWNSSLRKPKTRKTL
jgi:hypothetical protein